MLHIIISGDNGADDVFTIPENSSLKQYCDDGRFVASHDAIYGSFVFNASKSILTDSCTGSVFVYCSIFC